uniref:SOCS box domain-containing protein n=1 Tax=Lygus hesperus TaxID=30085 RepID=A0A0K8S767_LYGHE
MESLEEASVFFRYMAVLRYGANPDKAAALLSASPPSEVLRLILRAMPYPTSNILKIEPTLVLVPRLKHLCKIIVRNVLIKDIPKAIYDLPIPCELMEYLDLLKDF